MGCTSSREGSTEESAAPSGSSTNHTHSGFNSEITLEKNTFASALVSENTHKVEDVYDLSKGTVLGRGACGAVQLVTKITNGEKYAMKTVELDAMDGGSVEQLMTEIEIQKKLVHPNIVRIFESFLDKEHNRIHIIMEICTGGALVSRMRTHPRGYGEGAAATLVAKMLSATSFCHHHGIVHRDIKLDNFIYENESEEAELKLIDFGFACEVAPGREAMWEQLGTPSYMAPELCGDEAKEYDSSVDIWAIGVVAYMLLSGRRPFHDRDRAEKCRQIIHDPLSFPGREWGHISSEAKDFVKALLQKHPSKRPNASEAKELAWIRHASSLHKGEDAAHLVAKHEEILEALEEFCHSDDLKRVGLEVIAFSTPPAKLEELRDIFVKMDEDDSGTISRAEFQKAMAMHEEIPTSHVNLLYDNMDIDSSGEVDYMEFLSATILSQKSTNGQPSLHAAFAVLDHDCDGFITRDDIATSFSSIFSSDEIDAMLIRHVGAVENRLNFQQFKALMLSDVSKENLHDAIHSRMSSASGISP